MLTDAEKTDIRRFCGYPAYGASPSGNTGWRFYQAYGVLEYRMTNLSDSELAVIRGYLCALRGFEAAIPAAANNLDTSAAAVWTHNPAEMIERQRLERDWGRRMCGFLGVPPGPALSNGSSVALIV